MPPRHHPYSGYDAAGGQASGSGPRRGGPAGRGDRGRGGHHFSGPVHSAPPGQAGSPYGSSPPSSDSSSYPQVPQTSSTAPLRLGFGSPTRPGPPPPSSLPPAPGRPPIHLDGGFSRPPIHLGGMRPPPPGPGVPHQYPPPSPSQPPHYPSGPPPHPPPPHMSQQPHHQTGATGNDYGQRRSVSHDPYAVSDYSNPYTQPQVSGYPPNRPPPPGPPTGPQGTSPYPAYPPQVNFNNVDAANREPSFGADRSRGGPDRRAGAEPYNRDGTFPRHPPGGPGSKDQDPRTADEKPCRTLFIRSLDNSTSPESIRHHFLQFGEIKTFFDMIAKKGMCFVTFFDLRGAEWAKNTCHGQDFNGRRMDVHYSLPKNTDTSKRCDRDQNQGTLFMLLKRLARALTDDEFKAIFSSFGEVKSVRRYKDQKNARFLEFYDSRACIAAHDGMGGQQYTDPVSGSGGEWDVKFAWDAQQIGKGNANAKGPAGGPPQATMAPPPAPPSSAGGWSPPPSGPYQQGGPPPMRPPPPGMGHEARPPPSGPGSGPGPGQYQPPGPVPGPYGYNDAGAAGRPPHAASPPQGPAQWGPARPPSAPPSAPSGPGGSASGGREDSTSRLEQAQKVQQLLASLSSGSSSSSSAGNSATPAATSSWQGGQASASGPSDGGTAGSGQSLPPNLAQLLAGVGGVSGGQPSQQQGADPRRSGAGSGTGGAGGGGGAAAAVGGGSNPSSGSGAGGGSSSAADAQQSIQRMLAMLGQQQGQSGSGSGGGGAAPR
ncbi:hypothetical protein BCV69DRAFT_282677 [Microstroma glucosiphilum]|uniref:RRM domain-containing protein n=1 Tax=Pseudomicrostroma glucosiphilum TaxID=1684307 RepID=A0A316U9U9_9BASI|nr:hypothetical protein BCV69DRAFT_282677 [Pseudomicrostroma glucosiphilum]PWN21183.1 hypothetical protein BCV69DRAFT_282677 [Pseudomicrostroma glucosiphilum]